MPTEQCNFRCTYCYEDFALPRMRPQIVLGLETWIRKRAPELEQLDVAWFGGEPLLAYDIVERVQRCVVESSRAHARLDCRGSMTTNAYLLDEEKLRRLVSLGVRRYQITLDGSEEYHDRCRVRADGSGTYSTIWGNLLNAHSSPLDFEIVLRIHVTRDNQDAIRSLLLEARRAFSGDSRFRVFIRELSRLGGPNDAMLPVLEPDTTTETIASLREEAISCGLVLPSGAEDKPTCYAAAANSFVIRSDGSVAKCTVALTNSRNRVGVLKEDGTVDIDGRKVAPWMRGLFSGDEQELHCPMIGFADQAAPVEIAGGR